MTTTKSRLIPLTLAIASFGGLPAAPAADDDTEAEIQALREQIRRLDEKLQALERKQALKEQEAAKAAPRMSFGEKGFTVATGDGANAVSIRGLVQFDSRVFFGDRGIVNNTFLLRRARPILEGTIGGITSFQLVPEFGGTGAPSILDANVAIALTKSLQIKFGKFKAPLGLELLQSDSWTFFNERSLVSSLVPNRDVGVQLGGTAANGAVTYAAGVFNGVADGASSTNADFDNDKDLVGRVFYQPFRDDADSALQGLAFGVAGSLGRSKSISALPAGYKTDGQQTFFKYRAAAVADGQTWRVSPQAEYLHGPLRVIGEYAVSTVNVRPAPGAAKIEVRNKAWQVAAGYVLTGEKSSAAGVIPRQPFNWENGAWGAWEVVGRFAGLKIDDRAFPLLADPAASADAATSFGLGLNWYLSRPVKISVDYYQTRFDFNSAAPSTSTTPVLRQDEEALITRFQLSF